MTYLLVALAIVAGAALYALDPDGVSDWYRRIATVRRYVFQLAAIVVALLFIGSGVVYLMAIGFISIVFAVLFLLVEDPLNGASDLVLSVRNTLRGLIP